MACCAMRSLAALGQLHSDCTLDNQALVCQLTDTCDLLLAPLPSTGAQEPGLANDPKYFPA